MATPPSPLDPTKFEGVTDSMVAKINEVIAYVVQVLGGIGNGGGSNPPPVPTPVPVPVPVPTPVPSIIVLSFPNTPVDASGAYALKTGETAQALAVVKDSSQVVIDPTLLPTTVVLTSSNPSVLSITSGGLVTAVTSGAATITATCGSLSATALFAVTVPGAGVVTQVVVLPGSAAMNVGDVLQLTVKLLDALGAPVSGAAFTASSSDPSVVTVSPQAGLAAVAAGSATVTIASNGLSAAVSVTVTQVAPPPPPPPVTPVPTTLRVSPTSLSLVARGTAGSLSALVYDQNGVVMSGQPISWSTSNANVATVSSAAASPSIAAGASAVVLTPSDNIQTAVNANPVGTQFVLRAGTYVRPSVVPKSGMAFLADPGVIFDGESVTVYAFDKGSAPYPTNVRVQGIEIKRYNPPVARGAVNGGGDAPSEGTNGWIVVNNEIHHNATMGVRVGHQMRVQNNRVHDNGELGMGGIGDGALIENNEIAYNNSAFVFDPNNEGGGAKFVLSDGMVIRGNFVHHNGGPGLWTDINNIRTLYELNQVEDNAREGIVHEISYAATIRYNTVRRNGLTDPSNRNWLWNAGIAVHASPDVEVYGNIVDGNKSGIVAIQQLRTDSPSSFGAHIVANLKVHGNTVTQTSAGRPSDANCAIGAVQDLGDNSIFTSRNNTFTGNALVLGANTQAFSWLNANRTLSEWQGYGFDLTSAPESAPSAGTTAGSVQVTPVAAGSALVSATSGSLSASASVSVASAPLASVTVSPKTVSGSPGKTQQLTAVVKDTNGATVPATVTWTTADATIATVSSTGLVTLVGVGSSPIDTGTDLLAGTVITAAVGLLTDTCTASVDVVKPVTPPPGGGNYSSLTAPSTEVYLPRPMATAPVGYNIAQFPNTFLDSRSAPGGTPLTFVSDVLLTDSGNPTTNTTTLQAAIDAARTRTGHSRIRLPDGWICYTTKPRKHTQGAYKTYVLADAMPGVEGVKVTQAQMANKPIIRCNTNAGYALICTEPGADHTRFGGIVFDVAPTVTVCRNLVLVDYLNPATGLIGTTNSTDLPDWIGFDRCWIKGTEGITQNGLVWNTRTFFCVDSIVSGITLTGIESHDVIEWNALGPAKFVGNDLGSGSSNFFMGGADPSIVNGTVADVEFRRNKLSRPSAWNKNLTTAQGWNGKTGYAVKNSFEVKNARRVLCEANDMSDVWVDGQVGYAAVFKSENQNGNAPWVTCQDITFRYNRLHDIAQPFSMAAAYGQNTASITNPTERVTIEHNLIFNYATAAMGNNATRPFALSNTGGIRGLRDIIVRHNTTHSPNPGALNIMLLLDGTQDGDRLAFLDNIAQHGQYGIFGGGSQPLAHTGMPAEGINTLDTYWNSWMVAGNLIINPTAVGSYPSGNFWPSSDTAVGFKDLTNRDFTLATSSPWKGKATDGTDPGADIPTVTGATAGL